MQEEEVIPQSIASQPNQTHYHPDEQCLQTLSKCAHNTHLLSSHQMLMLSVIIANYVLQNPVYTKLYIYHYIVHILITSKYSG